MNIVHYLSYFTKSYNPQKHPEDSVKSNPPRKLTHTYFKLEISLRCTSSLKYKTISIETYITNQPPASKYMVVPWKPSTIRQNYLIPFVTYSCCCGNCCVIISGVSNRGNIGNFFSFASFTTSSLTLRQFQSSPMILSTNSLSIDHA